MAPLPAGSFLHTCACGAQLLVRPEHKGKRMKCPRCDVLVAPQAPASPPASAPAPKPPPKSPNPPAPKAPSPAVRRAPVQVRPAAPRRPLPSIPPSPPPTTPEDRKRYQKSKILVLLTGGGACVALGLLPGLLAGHAAGGAMLGGLLAVGWILCTWGMQIATKLLVRVQQPYWKYAVLGGILVGVLSVTMRMISADAAASSPSGAPPQTATTVLSILAGAFTVFSGCVGLILRVSLYRAVLIALVGITMVVFLTLLFGKAASIVGGAYLAGMRM